MLARMRVGAAPDVHQTGEQAPGIPPMASAAPSSVVSKPEDARDVQHNGFTVRVLKGRITLSEPTGPMASAFS